VNPQAFKILEFDALRALVRGHAQTDTGRARIDSLAPIDDYQLLHRELRAVREMIDLRTRAARLSFEGITDPTESITRLKIAGTALEPLAMLDLARLCERAVDARAAIVAEREASPTLFEIVAPLSADLKKLAGTLQKKLAHHALTGKPDAPIKRSDSGRTGHRAQRSLRDSRPRRSSIANQRCGARLVVVWGNCVHRTAGNNRRK
jgi:hypothetical protein